MKITRALLKKGLAASSVGNDPASVGFYRILTALQIATEALDEYVKYNNHHITESCLCEYCSKMVTPYNYIAEQALEKIYGVE